MIYFAVSILFYSKSGLIYFIHDSIQYSTVSSDIEPRMGIIFVINIRQVSGKIYNEYISSFGARCYSAENLTKPFTLGIFIYPEKAKIIFY